MKDSKIQISVLTQSDLVFENLKKEFEQRGFLVERAKEGIDLLGDYLIVDFTSTQNFIAFKEVLKNTKVKAVSIIKHEQEEMTLDLLRLNSYSSVAKVNDLKNYDYTDSLLKELFSFGHIGKSFNLVGGKAIKHQETEKPQPQPERVVSYKNQLGLKLPKITSRFGFKRPAMLLLIILFLLSLSGILQAFALGSLYFAVKSLYSNINKSEKLLLLSQKLNDTSSFTTLGIPAYEKGYETIKSSQNLFQDALVITNDSKLLFEKVTGDEMYKVEDIANNLSASLDKLYSDLGFFETHITSQSSYWSIVIKKQLLKNSIELSEIRSKVYSAKMIASRLDNLLGSEKAQRFLVLFQNNMELRPTGGFIGSFAIITFEGGRLTDINVSDVYSADGQLKGYVEPPQPIKDILGEASWYLRDSNWDPDFSQSAQKAEWFLDKEVDQEVDGVIGVDLNLVKSLLSVTGELKLVDFNQTVNVNNVYQITQNEVESNFFPGSTKKASFLTSLARTLLLELENLEPAKKPAFLKAIYEGLDQKHIQVYSHDQNTQSALKDLGFDGGVDMGIDCGERCFFDKYMLVDANLGVNKANFFIQRQHLLNLRVNKENIRHQLEVDYTNSANSTLGTAGKYKTYTRLFLPVNARVESVKIYNQSGIAEDIEFSESITDLKKEVGFLIEVLPLFSKKVQIVWSIDTQKLLEGGEYRLKVFKQAGSGNDPFTIVFDRSNLSYVATTNIPFLTGGSLPSYNTLLTKDLLLKSFFSLEEEVKK